jgi:hypothetical protein
VSKANNLRLKKQYENQRERWLLYAMWQNARDRARAAKLPFTITIQDILNVWPADNMCPVLQVPFKRIRKKAGPFAPSLDRLKPAKGYTPTNIAVISTKANRIKSEETDPAVFYKVGDWLQRSTRAQD